MQDMRERLKETDNRVELSSIDIKKLNKIIEDCLKNRKNSTNYQMLEAIARRMSENIRIPNRCNEPIKTDMDAATVQEIALEFFKSIDVVLYKKANAIINQETPIQFKIYKREDISDAEFEEKDTDGIPKYSKEASVHNNGKRTVMFIPLNGTTEDIYLLVHEISHTFDLNIENDSRNGTRNLLGEVTPAVFEALLSEYLLKNEKVKRQDVYAREKGGTISKYDDGVETYTKLVLMDLIKRKGEITIEDIQKIQKQAKMGTNTVKCILGRLLNSPADVDYRARYMIAQLVYPYIVDRYKNEPNRTMGEIRKYFEAIKENQFGKALKSLGLSLEEYTIDSLININNNRIRNLEVNIEQDRRECV